MDMQVETQKKLGATRCDVGGMPGKKHPAPQDIEVFSFMGTSFNITRVLQDLAASRISPQKIQFNQAFIHGFATRIHGLTKDNPQATTMSLLTGVRAVEVHPIPDSAFNTPLVLAYVGKNKGVLDLDGTGAHYLLIDGNKRLGKAFFTDREALDVVVLNQAQTRKYKMK